MKVVFNPLNELSLRPEALNKEEDAKAGVLYAGSSEFLTKLREQLGLNPSHGSQPTRIEQYMKGLEKYAQEDTEAFYKASFDKDPVSAAKVLLNWRDELKWAEWDFETDEDTPPRLKVMGGVEKLLREPDKNELEDGVADRWVAAKRAIEKGRPFHIEELYCLTPYEMTPPFFQRFLELLKEKGVEVSYRPEERKVTADKNSDLGRFQHYLVERQKGKAAPSSVNYQGDGSLILLKADTERELAQFIVRTMEKNESYRPVLLPGQGSQDILSEELTRNGLPGIGERMDMAAAPVPQLFFLTAQTLWDPLDPDRMMEFLTLPKNPLPKGLRYKLAEVLSKKPGRFSEEWKTKIQKYLEEFEAKEGEEARKKLQDKIDFWLHHDLYDEKEGVPVRDLRERYEVLRKWAHPQKEEKGEEGGNEDPEGFQLLSKLISSFQDMLRGHQPEEKLSRTLLEKQIDEVHQEEKRKWIEPQANSLPVIPGGEALREACNELLWWGFCEEEETSSFSMDWIRPEEKDYLLDRGVEKDLQEKVLERRWWSMEQVFLSAKERAVLTLPQKVNGKAMKTHPLMGDLESSSSDLSPLSFFLEEGTLPELPNLKKIGTETHTPYQLPEASAYWSIDRGELIQDREEESHSSLEKLFYHPHEWVLRYHAGIASKKAFRTPDLNSLEGTLAHRFAEELFSKGVEEFDEERIEEKVEELFDPLLAQEGSFFLMKGYRNRKEVLRRKVLEAMKALLKVLKDGDWQVHEMEGTRNGHFKGIPVTAEIDMILERESGATGIIDLKRRGKHFEILDQEKEIQLVLYADILSEEGPLPPTAYFNIEQARLNSRYKEGFPSSSYHGKLYNEEGESIPETILQRMEATYDARLQELQNGRIELGYDIDLEEIDSYAYMDGEKCLPFPEKEKKKLKPFDHEFANLIEIR